MNMTAVAIIAIICWAIVSIVRSPKKQKVDKQVQFEAEALKAELADLKDRVATLEAIVTDEKYSLRREFDNLKRDNAA